ncbi:auxilin-like protein 1 isoform X2 [Rhodamnia argentea]|uniref:Auxilin-like protein 1 isoform X2 n=1 Tax=Rhodamnia argentea TaxID=178133 RepID=A0A8B8NWU4_9MYRT|nr:auxilin-like protein 1 isoform X2 [Rhodamnia argentea]
MSTEYQASAPPFARKLVSGRSFSGTSIYDGVFAGPGKYGVSGVSSRAENYAEIFGGSRDARRSSIPVLDFPGLHERKVSVDVRSSKLDYSKIFGGFGDFGDTASYEELVNKRTESRSFARTQDSMRSSSKLSSSSLNETQVSCHEASYHSRDREKKFNVSYSKVNLETNGETNKRVHIAQLGDVPGYAHVIEETAPLEQSKGNKPQSVVVNGYASGDAGDGMVNANNCEKAMSGVSATGSDKPSTKEGISIQKSDRNRSFTTDLFFGTYEYGLRKEPFGSQTPIDVPSNSKIFGVSPSNAFEDVAGVYSPPDFDDNVDANSVAAASAAAVKKAIEKAQAKIKVARELMERRKEGLQGHVNFKEKIGAEDKRARKMAKKANRCSEKEPQKIGETDNRAQLAARARGANNENLGFVNVESGDKENVSSSKTFSGSILQQANKEIHADLRLGKVGEEAENSYEAAQTKQNGSVPIEQQKEGIGVNDMMPSCDECSSETLAKIDFERSTVEEALDEEKIDEKLLGVTGAQEGDKQEVKVQSAQGLTHPEESEIKVEVALEQEGNLWKFMKFFNPWQSQGKPKELNKSEFDQRLEAQDLDKNNLRSLGEECDWEGNKMKQIEAHKRELTSAHNHEFDGEMSNFTWKEMSSQEVDEALRDSCERLVVLREREETCNPKENDDEHDNFGMEPDSEERLETLHQQERLKERPNDLVESKKDKGLEEEKEAGDIHEIARANVNEEIHEDTKQMNANAGQQEAFNSTETNRIEEITGMGVEDEVEESHEIQNSDDNAICTCEREACEEFTGTPEGDEPNESDENIDVLMDEMENERDEKMVEMNSSVRGEENDCSLGASANDYDLEKRCKVETSDITCFMLKADEINEEVGEGEATAALEFTENYVNLSDAGMSSGGKQNGQAIPEFNAIPNLEVPVQGLAPEFNNYSNDLHEAEKSMNWKEESEFSKSEEVNSDAGSSDKGGSFDGEMTMQPEQINGTIERKERTQEAHQSIETCQNTEKIEENHYTTLTMEEGISEDCQQKEIGLDKEFLKKIDEAKERERAREKERLAVERAIREARERAYAEARERAERAAVGKATIEARQRVIEQAREKIGKASKETNTKLTEKNSIEARLKAERAAVERATAEARERALEKALAEKLSGAGKDHKLGQTSSHDPRHRGSCPSGDSRHPKSSDTNATGSGEKSDGTNSESAQRRKARLERHQRTAERAAKALAEKNKHDLLAQREHAERNRLAESLDADIKRWSSGKQGNLRALLSTLQYILGPDSSWQPVSLTEIVTAAAVKKAYRKATLCVHPDKLQQRGASLQQKYVCEKVFDLLKEAWNKFSSAEER